MRSSVVMIVPLRMRVTIPLNAQKHSKNWDHDAVRDWNDCAAKDAIIFKVCAVKNFLERNALCFGDCHFGSLIYLKGHTARRLRVTMG